MDRRLQPRNRSKHGSMSTTSISSTDSRTARKAVLWISCNTVENGEYLSYDQYLPLLIYNAFRGSLSKKERIAYTTAVECLQQKPHVFPSGSFRSIQFPLSKFYFTCNSRSGFFFGNVFHVLIFFFAVVSHVLIFFFQQVTLTPIYHRRSSTRRSKSLRRCDRNPYLPGTLHPLRRQPACPYSPVPPPEVRLTRSKGHLPPLAPLLHLHLRPNPALRLRLPWPAAVLGLDTHIQGPTEIQDL